MNVRLRVLVAVAATALGMMGTVAAVPASASVVPASASLAAATEGEILSLDLSGYGVEPLGSLQNGDLVYVVTYPDTYKTDCSAGMTYNGEDYCEVRDLGTNFCLEDDHTGITGFGTNLVVVATCDSSIVSQDWWWSGQRFRNLYAIEKGYDACMNINTQHNYLDVYLCSVDTSKWSF